VDACDAGLVQQWVARGLLPTFEKLFATGAIVDTKAPTGFFVSAIWPTLVTAQSPSRHRYTCWVEVLPGRYELRETTPREVRGTPFADELGRQGLRTAMLDVPHVDPASEPLGVQLSEWGCHDRHFGPASWPATYLDDVNTRFGPHPVGCAEPAGARQFAPCDYAHRAGAHRTPSELEALWNDLLVGHRRKAALSLDLLDRGGWDLFMTVFGEAHCVGHQFWHVHDVDHPRHDPAVRARLGDPILEMYRLIDTTLGEHLARLDADTTVYVQLSHGMGPHYDGDHLLEHVLRRFEDGTSDDAVLPSLSPEAIASDDRRRSRWFAVPNNTVTAAIRINCQGREEHGVVAPGREFDEACAQLSTWLRELVNADTGEPLVTDVRRTDHLYERIDGDAFPDLLVDWNRSSPIERVRSPRIGTIEVAYTHWRTGDHHDRGLLMGFGPGIAPGRRTEPARIVDIAPTLCAALGVELPNVEGVPIADLVPHETVRGRRRRRLRGQLRDLVRTHLLALLDVPTLEQRIDRAEGELHLLATAHHETRLDAARALGVGTVAGHRAGDAHDLAGHAQTIATEAHQALAALPFEAGIERLARLLAISSTTQWIDVADVPENLLISVVVPTRNRAARLARAVQSVLDQRYQHWELVIVDDGSTDDTVKVLESFDDPRIRWRSIQHSGCTAARNVALEVLKGDVVVYLDDDNVMLPL